MITQESFLFNPEFVKQEISNQRFENIDEKMRILQGWVNNIERIKEQSEVQLQAVYFLNMFNEVLGYKTINTDNEQWDLEFENSTEIDSSTPDAILGLYSKDEKLTRAVIELKGPKVNLDLKQKRNTKNYGTPVDQAYSYAPKFDGCEWIIVSNIYEIRLYKNGTSQHYFERFYLNDIATNENEFKRFYLLLQKNNILTEKGTSKISELSNYTYRKRQEITDDFYTFYSEVRYKLWKAMVENNARTTNLNEENLLEKAQKILDRIIFIRFCEDQYLLPPNILMSYISEGERSDKVSTWSYVQELFKYIDMGSHEYEINGFNGGLFSHDADLDYLSIPDEDFSTVKGFFKYNFKTQLSVDVLGHIFEQSISDLEELKGQKEKTGKRKRAGVFYTPEYVTQYMVENSIGQWMEIKQEEIGIQDLTDWNKTEDKGWRKRYINEHIYAYTEYQKALQSIKILDPACGSGAFLTKAFDYLYKENVRIQVYIGYLQLILKSPDLEADMVELPGQLVDIDKSILNNNLYGVDLNRESVEITKLSLWIKTANKNEPLTALDENIVIGNSVIDSNDVVGEFALDWKKTFPQIFKQGGFDIVIGNPPYVPLEYMKKNEKQYYQNKYTDLLGRKWDLSAVFMRKSIDLIQKDGFVALIVPITWQTGPNYYDFRRIMFSEYMVLERLLNLPFDIFPDAYVDTCVFIGRTLDSVASNFNYLGYKYNKNERINTLALMDDRMDSIPVVNYMNHYSFKIFPNLKAYELHTKVNGYLKMMDSFTTLGAITKSTQGPVESHFNYTDYKESEFHFPYLKRGQGYRYFLNVIEKSFIDLSEKKSLSRYYINQPKIFFRRIINRQDRIVASYYKEDLVYRKDLNPFYITDHQFLTKYVLALVNSKLLSYIYVNFSSIALKDDYRQTTLTELRDLPIRKININQQKMIIEKVDALQSKLAMFHKKKHFASILIASELGMGKELSYKLKNFYDVPLNEFIMEAIEINNSLSVKNKENLNEIYMKYHFELSNAKKEILSLDALIDKKVYEIYMLDEGEIKEVEEYYSQFKESSSLFPRNVQFQ